MISLICCSRSDGNLNHHLPTLLQSLWDKTRDLKNIEMLVKFDDDDEGREDAIRLLKKAPFKTDCIVGPRENGYTSIHNGYSQLLEIASSRSRIVAAVADDMHCVLNDWDSRVLDIAHMSGIHFVIHGRPHPCEHYHNAFNPSDRNIHNVQTNYWFDVSFSLKNMRKLYVIDEAPMWSRQLLRACGDEFHVSFTDCWTLAIEKILFEDHGINVTRFTDMIFHRKVNEAIDGPSNRHRWEVERDGNFDFIASDEFLAKIKVQAQKIAEGLLVFKGRKIDGPD